MRRSPAFELDLGPAVPGWVLRGVLGLLGSAAVLLVGGATPGVLLLAAAAAATLGRSSTSAAAPLVCLAVGVGALLQDPGVGLRTCGLVLLVHLLLVLGAVALQAPLVSRVEWDVLADLLVRMAGPQLLAQVLVPVVALLSGSAGGGVAPRLVALTAAVALVLLVLRGRDGT